jgi:hypothetical protein
MRPPLAAGPTARQFMREYAGPGVGLGVGDGETRAVGLGVGAAGGSAGFVCANAGAAQSVKAAQQSAAATFLIIVLRYAGCGECDSATRYKCQSRGIRMACGIQNTS